MKTDEFFHEVFRFEADILSVLLDLKNHGKYHFDAISQKHTKKELDGIFRSSRQEVCEQHAGFIALSQWLESHFSALENMVSQLLKETKESKRKGSKKPNITLEENGA